MGPSGKISVSDHVDDDLAGLTTRGKTSECVRWRNFGRHGNSYNLYYDLTINYYVNQKKIYKIFVRGSFLTVK